MQISSRCTSKKFVIISILATGCITILVTRFFDHNADSIISLKTRSLLPLSGSAKSEIHANVVSSIFHPSTPLDSIPFRVDQNILMEKTEQDRSTVHGDSVHGVPPMKPLGNHQNHRENAEEADVDLKISKPVVERPNPRPQDIANRKQTDADDSPQALMVKHLQAHMRAATTRTFKQDAQLLEAQGLIRLLEICSEGSTHMITRELQYSGGMTKQLFLEHCFPIEIILPTSQRTVSQCTDFVFYVYYAGARISEDFPEDILSEHVSLCPKSIRLHGDAVVHSMFKTSGIRNFWMPNLDKIRTSEGDLFPLTETLFAKTAQAERLLATYLSTHNLTNKVSLVRAPHGTTDSLAYDGGSVMNIERNFSRAFHAYGNSSGPKSTRQLIECWMQYPEWPVITIVGDSDDLFRKEYLGDNLSEADNIIFLGSLSLGELRRLQRMNAMHVYPSSKEGAGHALNDARSNGALLITTDFGPMNEFVENYRTGLLISDITPLPPRNKDLLLLHENGIGIEVDVSVESICDAVGRAISMPIEQRRELADAGRRLFERDSEEAKRNLRTVKVQAVEALLGHSFSSIEADQEVNRIEKKLRDHWNAIIAGQRRFQ